VRIYGYLSIVRNSYPFGYIKLFYQFKDTIRLTYPAERTEISFLQADQATVFVTLRYHRGKLGPTRTGLSGFS
jgi:hypothetical protein